MRWGEILRELQDTFAVGKPVFAPPVFQPFVMLSPVSG
jgi:hypothetical protein